jgi:DICT domain-containing protein
MTGLPIREVAEQTGLAAGTIRMWEQRYGFPMPARTASGYRVYSDGDVDLLRRVLDLRRGGLSVPAALDRARATAAPEHPSIFGAVPHQGRSRRLRKRTLVAMAHAIEDQALASAARPVVLAAFQRRQFYRAVEQRYRRMAAMADLAVVFADFDAVADGPPVQVPIPPDGALGHEWAVVVDAPAFAACLVAWEPPVEAPPARDADREFEVFWTLEGAVVRAAARAGAACARETAPATAEALDARLRDRALPGDAVTGDLEALTGRMLAYLEAS